MQWCAPPQGKDGHLKPIPPEDDFATPRRGGTGGRTSPCDPNLALAIRLQQEEMARMRATPVQGQQGPLPPFVRNPVGPNPPPSLPQRARSALLQVTCPISCHMLSRSWVSSTFASMYHHCFVTCHCLSLTCQTSSVSRKHAMSDCTA